MDVNSPDTRGEKDPGKWREAEIEEEAEVEETPLSYEGRD